MNSAINFKYILLSTNNYLVNEFCSFTINDLLSITLPHSSPLSTASEIHILMNETVQDSGGSVHYRRQGTDKTNDSVNSWKNAAPVASVLIKHWVYALLPDILVN